MPKNPDTVPLKFAPVTANDFEALHAIRTAAMRPSLEPLGRDNPPRSRQRLRDSFYPEPTWFIILSGEKVGFYTLRPEEDFLKLFHLYVLPSHQSTGIGKTALTRVMAIADAAATPIHLTALRGSAANRFYQRHGFTIQDQDDWDIHYQRPATA
jgi:GNAT superfamily N-acetyltransferase